MEMQGKSRVMETEVKFEIADLEKWSKQITTVIRHTGKPERERHHRRPGRSTNHAATVRIDGRPVGSSMAVATILHHLHQSIPEEAFDQIIEREPRLSRVHDREPSGWIPIDSWRISAVAGHH